MEEVRESRKGAPDITEVCDKASLGVEGTVQTEDSSSDSLIRVGLNMPICTGGDWGRETWFRAELPPKQEARGVQSPMQTLLPHQKQKNPDRGLREAKKPTA